MAATNSIRKLMAGVIACIPPALTGGAIGWMVGLSVTDVTGSVVVGILAAATGFITQLVGGPNKEGTAPREFIEQAQWRLAIFALAVASFATIAAQVRGSPEGGAAGRFGPFLYAETLSPKLCGPAMTAATVSGAIKTTKDPLLMKWADAVANEKAGLTPDDLLSGIRLLCATRDGS